MKPLILAEKPSAARAIAAALGGFDRKDGYLESAQYRLAWAVGHLVELCDAQEYDPRYKRWTLGDLPIIPPAFKLRPVGRTAAQFRLVAKLMKDAPLLINACDAGREGELIFGYVCELAGVKRPMQRLWMQSLTPQAIRKAFSDLRPGEQYQRLYDSARCRSRGDWLVGINATRAYTVQAGELLSVGRVQTPTLALIVRRELEIEAFVSEPFWQVDASFATATGDRYAGRWVGADGDRLTSAAAATAIVQRCQGQVGQVESVESAEKDQPPPQLFDLTSLQRLANQRYRLSAAQTLAAAQQLYEAGLITYPRTDSRYLSRDLLTTLPGVLRALGPAFPELAAQANLERLHALGGRVVNDRKVTDHHAIIPTSTAPKGLSGAAARVYDLIARRLLAQCLPLHRYREAVVWTVVPAAAAGAGAAIGAAGAGSTAGIPAGPDRFRTRARQVLVPGWKLAEPDWSAKAKATKAAPGQDAPDTDDTATDDWVESLPVLHAQDRVNVREVAAHEGQTQPPKRFSEARLLAAMETAGRELDDEALREAMKERGLGTPATRASIIERLKDVGYIAAQGKDLVPTQKGRNLVAVVEKSGAQVLLAPDLTGEWEQRISQVQAGGYAPQQLLAEMERLTREIVTGVAGLPSTAKSRGGQRRTTDEPGEGAGEPGEALTEDQLPPIAGPCALCGRPVIRGSRDWTCLNHDCTLRIPRFLCGHVLTEEEVRLLITKQRTTLITGFTSKAGKPFSAFLLLTAGRVEFEFSNNRSQKGRTTGRRRGQTAAAGTSGTSTTSRTRKSTAAKSTAAKSTTTKSTTAKSTTPKSTTAKSTTTKSTAAKSTTAKSTTTKSTTPKSRTPKASTTDAATGATTGAATRSRRTKTTDT